MTQLSVRDEQDIQELIAQGNDPVATRLVYELLDLDQAQVQERVQHLFRLGDRYMALALMQEDGRQEDQALVPLLERRCHQALSFLPVLSSLPVAPEEEERAAGLVSGGGKRVFEGDRPDHRLPAGRFSSTVLAAGLLCSL